MFTGYFDESYTSGAAVVAGCVCHEQQLERLDKKWWKLLSDFGVQGGFHMKEFIARTHRPNQYSSWDEKKCRAFFERMIRIIAPHTAVSVGVALDQRVYSSFVNTPERRAVFNSKYVTASRLCLDLVDRWAKKRRDVTRINFVFDRGDRHANAFKKAYDAEYKRRDRFGGLSFEDDQEFAPLQGADFVAYILSKGWSSRDREHWPVEETFLLARQTIKKNWRVLNSPRLLRSVARKAGIK